MTNREDPFVLPLELLHQFDELGLMPKELRCSASNQEHGFILFDADGREGHVAFDEIAWFLDIGIPAGIEIVNDRVEPLLLRGRDHGLIARFAKAVLRV